MSGKLDMSMEARGRRVADTIRRNYLSGEVLVHPSKWEIGAWAELIEEMASEVENLKANLEVEV